MKKLVLVLAVTLIGGAVYFDICIPLQNLLPRDTDIVVSENMKSNGYNNFSAGGKVALYQGCLYYITDHIFWSVLRKIENGKDIILCPVLLGTTLYATENALYLYDNNNLFCFDSISRKHFFILTKVSSFVEVNDRLYYIKEEKENTLFCCKSDGSNEIKLAAGDFNHLALMGNNTVVVYCSQVAQQDILLINEKFFLTIPVSLKVAMENSYFDCGDCLWTDRQQILIKNDCAVQEVQISQYQLNPDEQHAVYSNAFFNKKYLNIVYGGYPYAPIDARFIPNGKKDKYSGIWVNDFSISKATDELMLSFYLFDENTIFFLQNGQLCMAGLSR